MPNYCRNSLFVEGPHETLVRIYNLMRGEENDFDFERIIPMPADVEDWFNWSCKNWGTKWNSLETHCEKVRNCLYYDFETAWSPCEPVIKKLAAMFPDAKICFSFSESGWGFCGKQEYENGRMTYEASGNYSEYWFDGYYGDDEDEKAILKEKDSPGVTCFVENEKDLGPATTYNFTYRDANDERVIFINGFCCDARVERRPFNW